jgi:hypothetical protein
MIFECRGLGRQEIRHSSATPKVARRTINSQDAEQEENAIVPSGALPTSRPKPVHEGSRDPALYLGLGWGSRFGE